MDVKFENRVTLTTAMAEEFVWSALKPMRIAVRIVTAVYVLWLAGQLLLASAGDPFDWVMAVCCGIIVVFLWIYPRMAAHKGVRRVRESSGGVMPETVVYFGDTIESHEADGVKHYSYGDILEVRSLKRSYMLTVGKNTGLPLSREGFVQGSFAEFKKFLRQKRPDLTIPE